MDKFPHKHIRCVCAVREGVNDLAFPLIPSPHHCVVMLSFESAKRDVCHTCLAPASHECEHCDARYCTKHAKHTGSPVTIDTGIQLLKLAHALIGTNGKKRGRAGEHRGSKAEEDAPQGDGDDNAEEVEEEEEAGVGSPNPAQTKRLREAIAESPLSGISRDKRQWTAEQLDAVTTWERVIQLYMQLGDFTVLRALRQVHWVLRGLITPKVMRRAHEIRRLRSIPNAPLTMAAMDIVVKTLQRDGDIETLLLLQRVSVIFERHLVTQETLRRTLINYTMHIPMAYVYYTNSTMEQKLRYAMYALATEGINVLPAFTIAELNAMIADGEIDNMILSRIDPEDEMDFDEGDFDIVIEIVTYLDHRLPGGWRWDPDLEGDYGYRDRSEAFNRFFDYVLANRNIDTYGYITQHLFASEGHDSVNLWNVYINAMMRPEDYTAWERHIINAAIPQDHDMEPYLDEQFDNYVTNMDNDSIVRFIRGFVMDSDLDDQFMEFAYRIYVTEGENREGLVNLFTTLGEEYPWFKDVYERFLAEQQELGEEQSEEEEEQ